MIGVWIMLAFAIGVVVGASIMWVWFTRSFDFYVGPRHDDLEEEEDA